MKDLDKIFKAYDIRGVYPDDINEEITYKIGRAGAKFLKAKELVIGRDVRTSSESLSKVLAEGIRDQGVKVIDIGLTTSPMFYFAVAKLNFKGGVMVTASHNPPEYNGFKIVNNYSRSLINLINVNHHVIIKDNFPVDEPIHIS